MDLVYGNETNEQRHQQAATTRSITGKQRLVNSKNGTCPSPRMARVAPVLRKGAGGGWGGGSRVACFGML